MAATKEHAEPKMKAVQVPDYVDFCHVCIEVGEYNLVSQHCHDSGCGRHVCVAHSRKLWKPGRPPITLCWPCLGARGDFK